MSDAKPLLEFEHVDTYYGQIHILNDVSLQVAAGELVCLLGGNASGKSTTLKTTLGIVRPRNGRVLFDGEDLGYTIFVIEHDMHLVEGISDRVIALDHGIKIAEGSFDEVATDPSVVEAYLGLRAEQAS